MECYLLYLEATHSVSEWKINVIRCEVSCIFVIYVFCAVLCSRELRQGKACDNFLFICLCYVCVHFVIIRQHLTICGMYIMKTLFTLRAFYVTFVRFVKRNLSAVCKFCIDFRLHECKCAKRK